MTRYNHLLELIDKYKPRTLIEIGVWNGANAIRMIRQAQQYHPNIEYTGYDLFEDATDETDKKEFNVKGHNRVLAVAAYIRAETGVEPQLIKGDTNKTLKPSTIADFVFLDGGHSIETIKHDFECVCLSPVVVLDDFYTPDETGASPDIKKYGCNYLFDSFATGRGDERIHEVDPNKISILSTKDSVKGGGYTRLVVIERGNI